MNEWGRRRTAAEALALTGSAFHTRGWCLGTSGNLSVVTDAKPLRLLITRSGSDKGALGSGDFVLVDAEGQVVPGEGARPSAEAALHAAVVRCSGASCVLHTHSVAATLLGDHFRDKGGFSISGYEMLKGLEGIDTHESSAFVPVLRNDEDIESVGESVEALFGAHPELQGFLIAGHGLYTWGAGLEQARRHTEIFEFLFDVLQRRTTPSVFSG